MAKLLIFATAAHAIQLPNVLKRGKGAAPALEQMRFLNNEEARTVAQVLVVVGHDRVADRNFRALAT